MKKLLLSLSLVLLSGCSQTAPVEEETPVDSSTTPAVEDQEPANTYVWKEEDISFEVPEGLVVTKSQGQQAMVVLYKEDLTGFEGETLPGSITITLAEGTVEKQTISKSDVEEVKVGGNAYTLDTYLGDMTETMVAHYMLQKGTQVISIWADPSDERVQTILETLQLN